MKNLFLAIQLLGSLSVFSQLNPTQLSSELCSRETDGKGNSNNLKIKLTVPCNWEKTVSNQPNIVFNYDYKTTGLVRVTLTITKMPSEVTDAEIKSHFTLEGLKTIGSSSGTFVSSRLLTVNNLKGGEVIRRTISKKNDTDFYFYAIQNFFVLDRNLICIQYSYGALKDDFIPQYDSYLKTFRSLITKTTFNRTQ